MASPDDLLDVLSLMSGHLEQVEKAPPLVPDPQYIQIMSTLKGELQETVSLIGLLRVRSPGEFDPAAAQRHVVTIKTHIGKLSSIGRAPMDMNRIRAAVTDLRLLDNQLKAFFGGGGAQKWP